METAELIHECDTPLPVALECLGGTFRSQIGGVSVQVLVPRIHRPELDDRPALAPPDFHVLNSVKWEDFYASEEFALSDTPWGKVHSWHLQDRGIGIANVRRLGVRFSAEESDLNDHYEKFVENLEDWWVSLKAWIEIILSIRMTNVTLDRAFVPAFAWTRSSPGDPLRQLPPIHPPTLFMSASSDCITRARLARTFSIAGKEEPELEWRLIRSARQHLWEGRYRASVLDSGTAAELGLTRIIENLLQDAPAAPRRALLDKYKTLGGRGDLCRRLGGDVPSDLSAKLTEPRNRATHQGSELSEQQAQGAERVARLIVESVKPLPAV